MPTRPIAALTISFGMVAIPVKLYTATVTAERLSFHFVRQKDGSRVRQQYLAVDDGKPVERKDLAKAYEFAKNQYVQFTPQELKALEETPSQMIDIGEFVPLNTVDPVLYSSTYYLAPDKGGAKPYTLLVRALTKTERCAIGRLISHGREHVIVIRPLENALALHQLHFREEVLPVSALKIQPAQISENELKLAEQLIGQLEVKRFEPREFVDTFKKRVRAAIQEKVKGKEFKLAAPTVSGGGDNVIDLMQALRASVQGKRKPPGNATDRRPARQASRRSAAR
jgi:DNA end-binding protein Ku